MHAYLKALAVHQGLFHKTLIESWKPPTAAQAEGLVEGLVLDGLWLTKFPLLFTPTYGVERIDAWNKTRQIGPIDVSETIALRSLVDADVLRFVLKLSLSDLEKPVEVFWGGRAMSKPLWQYLAGWFERGAVLRGRFSSSATMFETVWR